MEETAGISRKGKSSVVRFHQSISKSTPKGLIWTLIDPRHLLGNAYRLPFVCCRPSTRGRRRWSRKYARQPPSAREKRTGRHGACDCQVPIHVLLAAEGATARPKRGQGERATRSSTEQAPGRSCTLRYLEREVATSGEWWWEECANQVPQTLISDARGTFCW